MFNNIGGKMKAVAYFGTILGSLISVIYAIKLIDENEFFLGLFLGIAGIFASWIASFGVYALGQIVENTEAIIRYELDKKFSGEK